MRTIQTSAIALLIIGIAVLGYFLNKARIEGYVISNDVATNYTVSGQFGDFVGGVVGTFFALSGTLLIFLNFREQTKENKRSGFESSFFEMIRLYRSNVSELKYDKSNKHRSATYENRQVLREIFQEFEECYKEIRRFSNSENTKDYFTKTYEKKLLSIVKPINPKINIIEMAAIDLAYMTVFFGLSAEGEQIIKNNIKTRYKSEYFSRLLHFLKLKPERSDNDRFDNWTKLLNLPPKDLHETTQALYKAKKKPESMITDLQLAKDFKMEHKYEKYYRGHQFRLGHYFRHLYQSFKYLNNHPDITDKEKYEYGKMYRAQLSTYEQALILINSISCLGMKWEFTPEAPDKKMPHSTKLITKYNIIKNLPGEHLSGIRYRTYYPNIAYESDEQKLR
ncbi:putative phage abortive infection protein [Pseudomonas sp. SZMC_28357]|uniref:putative phage abortive infection protein n=1 Tax=Pseudomonas sp. SZMC_28357 TaxID=3074380 RepID=UPI0028724D39|nr:putative phage abortive infection protein [Pseudomonas sp. SZMC_28357]MDR9754029.1 putative phage abortive infection protein [Pseudomonas sp. SZMC_28357]